MRDRRWSISLLATTLLTLVGCAADPKEEDAANSDDALTSTSQMARVVVEARRAQKVGEQASGYLGIVVEDDASHELKANVDDINIKRRALYTEISVRDHVTVQDVAHATACILFREKVALGETYRREDDSWAIHTEDMPVDVPSFCDAQQ